MSFITAASDIFSPRSLQISYLSSAGLLVSSVPAATWKKALANLEESMSRIKTVCDPDQPLDVSEWGKL